MTRSTYLAVVGLLLGLLTACGGEDGSEGPAPTAQSGRTTASADPTDPTPSARTGRANNQERTSMSITLTAGGRSFSGTLDDTPAARSLLAMLPLSLEFEDLAGEEKWARLPEPLDLSGAPGGTAGEPGGIYHYAPWQNLALFYESHGFAEGLVPLGRLDEDGVEFLASTAGSLTITIEEAR